MSALPELTKAEELAIELLKKAARHWPDTLWLYTEGGQLYVMKTNEDGEHVTEIISF